MIGKLGENEEEREREREKIKEEEWKLLVVWVEEYSTMGKEQKQLAQRTS